MILRSIFAVMFFSMILISCADKKEASSISESQESQEQMEKPGLQNQNSNKSQDNTIRLNSAQNSGTASGNSMQSVTPAGINPPHGQPGHDCSIPVGQPLDGSKLNTNKSGNAQNPTFQSGPRIQSTPQPSSGSNGTLAGMNPPHGQPGHDCSIPVGAPLKK